MRRALGVIGGSLLLAACGAGSSSQPPDAAMLGTDMSPADEGRRSDASVGSDGALGLPHPGDERDAGESLPDGGNAVPLIEGCPQQLLRAGIPEDLSQPGPWPVGALTTRIAGLTTEIWYPARIGSATARAPVVYDIREHLPEKDRAKLPDAHNPLQACECYRDLPLDDEAGPYPLLLFIHGTAGFRTTNLENMVHWASRGFVVVASDHPGIMLRDLLSLQLKSDQVGDARKVLSALAEPSGELAFLASHLDLTRVGIMGHSAGSFAATQLAVDAADVVILYAGGQPLADTRASSVLFVSGDEDGVAAPSTSSYDETTLALRRIAWIAHGGHLVGGSLCKLRDPGDPAGDLVALAEKYKLASPLLRPFMGSLFNGCNESPETPDEADGTYIGVSRGIEILSALSAGPFEEALHCSQAASTGLRNLENQYGADISRYAEAAGAAPAP